jgi:tetratricopeptide (TPR) repeat protein
MNNVKLLFRLFVRPASAMSDIIDRGNWFFAASAVLVVSALFFLTVNAGLDAAYGIPEFGEFYQAAEGKALPGGVDQYHAALAEYQAALDAKQAIPFAGDHFFKVSNFEPFRFAAPFVALSVFYVPFLIGLAGLFGAAGNFSAAVEREYGSLATCTLMAWAAAHLPFAAAGAVLSAAGVSPLVLLGLWVASSLAFAVLMVFAVRTVLGTGYRTALAILLAGSLGIVMATNLFQLASPLMFTPPILFFIYTFFSGRVGSEIRGYGTALLARQKAHRALEHAANNPYDASAHVQLGFVFRHRRLDARATGHFRKAVAADRNDLDANYELGKIARAGGRLQEAVTHFAIVVEQDERHSLSEIWREIGATYLEAGMLDEAREALEKFAERRPFDTEGLYYLGKVLKEQSDHLRARDVFKMAVEAARTSPQRLRRDIRAWRKLAQKELSAA